jgi:hypothetical protein
VVWNFCGFGLKRRHLIFADFFFCGLKISASKKNCLYYRKQQLKWLNDKQLVLITVILRSKNIFSSLESFQKLQLLNTHLVNFKFVLRNFFFTILLTGNTKSTVGSISVQSVIYFGYIFFSVEFSYFIICQLFKNNYD